MKLTGWSFSIFFFLFSGMGGWALVQFKVSLLQSPLEVIGLSCENTSLYPSNGALCTGMPLCGLEWKGHLE